MKGTLPKRLPLPPSVAGLGLALLALTVLSPWVAAESSEAIKTAIRSFLHQQTRNLGDEVRVEVLKTAVHFPNCRDPQAFLPRNTNRPPMGRLSVGVRCNKEEHNVRYVPVHVGVIGSYVTVAAALSPGTTVDGSLLERTRGDLSELPPGAVLDKSEAIGQLTTRRLSAGTVLQERHLRQVPVIERGETVKVESRGRGFVVSREGEALEGGGLGESIRVRISRRETLDAVISGKGRVRASSRNDAR